MFLRRLGKRGAEMVEYAIVLACIAAVGVGFYSSNDSKLTSVLDGLFGNVRQVLGLDNNGTYKLAVKENAKQYEEMLNWLFNDLIAKTPDYADPFVIKISDSGHPGNYYAEYSYKTQNGTKTEKYTIQDYNISFLKDRGYTLSGDNFFYFNPDDSLNTGNNSAPTRIMLKKTEGGGVTYLRYDAEEKKFYDNGGYFASP